MSPETPLGRAKGSHRAAAVTEQVLFTVQTYTIAYVR
jgi:hypothetical protein